MRIRLLIPSLAAAAAVAIFAAQPAPAAVNAAGVAAAGVTLPSLAGDTSCTWGSATCNRPVPNLPSQFRSLRDHGDLLGYRMGAAPDVTTFKHWQGIQRLMVGGARYLAVSRSGAGVSFVIAKMSSRNTTGERFRSNRIGSISSRVAPPPNDAVVKVVKSDPGYDHSGGIQAVGSYLAVGLEEGNASRVAFWDVRNPEYPVRVGTLAHTTGVKGAGTVSIARLAGGRYLLIVGGSGANTLDVYVSRPSSLLSSPSFDHATTWHESQLLTSIPGDREFGNYQNLSLMTDSSGKLYLIGTHRNSVTGADWADLFRLENGDGNTVRITKVAKRHLYCGAWLGGNQCNLDAAGGSYVTPSGRLLLYGTEHDNDGPLGSVKLEEFRPVPHRSSCTTINQAWVELYDDSGYDGDRSVMIDYPDRAGRDYTNYDRVDGFEDKASAGSWCLPSGWRYRLYQHKSGCGGRVVDLVGTGYPARDPRFGDDSGPVRNFNDAVSCSAWIAP